MKCMLAYAVGTGLTIVAVAGYAQSESDSTRAGSDDGNSSWSHSYSRTWGDPAPRGSSLPSWNRNWPQAGFGTTPPPMPSPDQGFPAGWHVPMPGPAFGPFPDGQLPAGPGSSFSSSSSSNSFSISGALVMSALGSLQFSTGVAVRLTPDAAKALSDWKEAVSLSEVQQTPLELATKMLTGTGCEASMIENELVICVGGEEVDSAVIGEATRTLSELLFEEAVKRPITLTMWQTPLPFVAQMLQGMSGVPIELPEEHRSFFYTPQPRIDIQADQTPLLDVLASIARQIDAEVVVRAGIVQLRSKKPATN